MRTKMRTTTGHGLRGYGIDTLWPPPFPKYAEVPWYEEPPEAKKHDEYCVLCGKKLCKYNKRHDVCWACDTRELDGKLTDMMTADLMRATGPLSLYHRFGDLGFFPNLISQSLKTIKYRLKGEYEVKVNRNGHYLVRTMS